MSFCRQNLPDFREGFLFCYLKFRNRLVSLCKAFGRGGSLTDALLRCLTYPPAVATTSVQAFLLS